MSNSHNIDNIACQLRRKMPEMRYDRKAKKKIKRRNSTNNMNLVRKKQKTKKDNMFLQVKK